MNVTRVHCHRISSRAEFHTVEYTAAAFVGLRPTKNQSFDR